MALQYVVNGREMAGWGPLNEQLVKTNIESSTAAFIKSNNDVKTIKETLKNGCTMCHILLPETVQIEELIANQNEEAVFNFIIEESKDTK